MFLTLKILVFFTRNSPLLFEAFFLIDELFLQFKFARASRALKIVLVWIRTRTITSLLCHSREFQLKITKIQANSIYKKRSGRYLFSVFEGEYSTLLLLSSTKASALRRSNYLNIFKMIKTATGDRSISMTLQEKN